MNWRKIIFIKSYFIEAISSEKEKSFFYLKENPMFGLHTSVNAYECVVSANLFCLWCCRDWRQFHLPCPPPPGGQCQLEPS
ncbi:hypothetical protein CEXT_199121 [Caerostris extrusa]|uniref:Uncharacterized protein n=1 Tax=Caerostris extrusa TaxID=172846 RepID=A0AAV4WRI9_CAEEX|nr:hypothetical protein CEXT_199121 [Caerostris extrusa]